MARMGGDGVVPRWRGRWRALLGLGAVLALGGFLVGGPVAQSVETASIRAAAAVPSMGTERAISPARFHHPSSGEFPAVAFDGTNHLVVWSGTSLHGSLVSPSGELVDDDLILIDESIDASYAAVAFDGTNYLVVWATSRNPTTGDLRAARVSTTGEVLDPEGITIAAEPVSESLPTVAFDGTNFLVAWQARDNFGPIPFPTPEVRAARLSPAGEVLDAPRAIAGATTTGPLVFDGTNYLFAWADGNGAEVARLAPDGTVLAPGAVRLSATTPVSGVDAAFDGENWHVAWAEQVAPAGSTDIYRTRVDAAGSVLDPAGSTVSRAASGETRPTVGRSGDGVLVTWTDDRAEGDVYGARVSRSGTVLDATPFAVAAGPGQQEAISTEAGEGQVLVTITGTYGERCCATQVVRVSDAGAVLDPSPRQVSRETNRQYNPQIASDGTDHLVAWNDDRSGTYWGGVYVSRMSADGESLDPDGILVSADGDDFLTDVVFDGENYLVAFQRLSSNNVDSDVFVSIVGRDGRLVTPEPLPVGTGAGPDFSLRLSPDGTNTLAVWDAESGVVGARISRAGEVLAPGVFPISSSDTIEFGYPAAVFDGQNHLVVYSRAGDGTGLDVVARRVSPSGQVLDATAKPIAVSAASEFQPELAWSGQNHLVLWQSDGENGERQVVGARVSRAGEVLGSGPFAISTGSQPQTWGRVASLDGWFLVTWMRELESFPTRRTEVLAARIHESGDHRDPVGFVVGEGASAPDVAAGEDGWQTVYRREVDRTTNVDRVFSRSVAPK